ncbi:hypothetical protein KM043_013989 [Ampulex compressa]|nr:hypothetical protein KM043_013989 [Ampulex compressa]
MVEILYKKWCKGGGVATQPAKVSPEPQPPQATGAPFLYGRGEAPRKTKTTAIINIAVEMAAGFADAHSKDQSWLEGLRVAPERNGGRHVRQQCPTNAMKHLQCCDKIRHVAWRPPGRCICQLDGRPFRIAELRRSVVHHRRSFTQSRKHGDAEVTVAVLEGIPVAWNALKVAMDGCRKPRCGRNSEASTRNRGDAHAARCETISIRRAPSAAGVLRGGEGGARSCRPGVRARKAAPDPNKVQAEFSPWQSHWGCPSAE